MTDSDMSDACLKQVNLKGTDFGGVNVTGTKFVGCDMDDGVAEKLTEQGVTAVSYTHLTLPTICSV